MSRWLPVCLLAFFSFISSTAFAGANVLTADHITANPGDKSVQLDISMNNEDRVAGYEFHIILPPAMTMLTAETAHGAHTWDAKYLSASTLLSGAKDGDGDGHNESTKTFAFTIALDDSGKVASIPAGDGVLVSLFFDIAEGTDGEVHDIDLINVVLSDHAGSALTSGAINGSITIGDPDLDKDGYSSSDDCDDNNPDINPGATEIPYDGIDQDCSGADLTDVDEDGFDSDAVDGGDDCDDENADINPSATEIPYDGIDQDCEGTDLTDVDEDGFDSDAVDGGDDCDDENADIYPGADDILDDGIDQDCDGEDATSEPQDTDEKKEEKEDETGGCNCNTGAFNPSVLFGLIALVTVIRRRRAA